MSQPSLFDHEWNSRYVAFARTQGRTPEDQLAHDKARYPAGGCMIPFIQWSDHRLIEFFGFGLAQGHASEDRWVEYDAWLDGSERAA